MATFTACVMCGGAERDGTELELGLKSTYLRRSQQDTWQHETTTLRKAGDEDAGGAAGYLRPVIHI
jgi:hypothetical protein